MKRLKLFIFVALTLSGILLSARNTNAQVGYAISTLEPFGNYVHGYSATILYDYNTSVWYQASVTGSLYDQNGIRADYGSADGDGSAEVETWKFNPAGGDHYKLISEHYVRTNYVYNDNVGYWDAEGLSFLYRGEESPSPYGIQSTETSTVVYEQRIHVATTRDDLDIPLTAPQLTSIDADTGVPGGNPIQTVLRGSNLYGSNRYVQVSGGGGLTFTLQPLTNNTDIVDVNIQIDQTAPFGDRQISLVVDGQTSNNLTFHVGDRTPTITSIDPSELGAGESATVTITGANFGTNPEVQVDCCDVTVSQTTVNAAGTQIQAVFSVGNSANAGVRQVTVVSHGISGMGFQSGAGEPPNSNSVGFEIKPLTVTFQQFQIVGKGVSRNINVTVSQQNNAKNITLTIVKTSSGDANFSNNTKTIQIPQVNQSVEIKGITESGAKDDLSIKANTNNSPSESFSVAKIKISRTIGTQQPTDVTDLATPTIVGERIQLSAEIVPSGISLSNSLWTLPGKVMYDFKIIPSPPNPISPTVFQSASEIIPALGLDTSMVDYVWYDGGDNREVTYKANDGGYSISGKTIFNVKRPEAKVVTITPTITAIDTAVDGKLELHLGLDDAGHPGIKFITSSIVIPPSFMGDTQWVQTISRTLTFTNANGTFTVPDSGLDGCYPFDPVINAVSTYDSPGIEIAPLSYVKYDSQWSMWLMFKPNGNDSSWVPLRKVDWNWLGEAQLAANSKWRLIKKSDPNQPNQPVDADTTSFPIWSVVIPSLVGGSCQ